MVEVVASDHVPRVLEGDSTEVIIRPQLPHAMSAPVEVSEAGQRLLKTPGIPGRFVGRASCLWRSRQHDVRNGRRGSRRIWTEILRPRQADEKDKRET